MKPFSEFSAWVLLVSLILIAPAFSEPDLKGHIKNAQEHVNMAVKEGSRGDAGALAQHAEVGLKHVKMAQEIKSLPDLDRAAEALDGAIKLGKSGNAKEATERTQKAVNSLDAALAGLGG